MRLSIHLIVAFASYLAITGTHCASAGGGAAFIWSGDDEPGQECPAATHEFNLESPKYERSMKVLEEVLEDLQIKVESVGNAAWFATEANRAYVVVNSLSSHDSQDSCRYCDCRVEKWPGGTSFCTTSRHFMKIGVILEPPENEESSKLLIACRYFVNVSCYEDWSAEAEGDAYDTYWECCSSTGTMERTVFEMVRARLDSTDLTSQPEKPE